MKTWIRKGLYLWYGLNGLMFWAIIGLWIAWSPWILVSLPLFIANLRLITLANRYADDEYEVWKEEFSKTHTFLYTQRDPDPEGVDINHWRDNDTWQIIKQVAGQKKLIK